LGSQQPPIWAPLHEVWSNLTRIQSVGSGSDNTSSQHTYLVVSLARFTRNFVADVPFNQKSAFIIEPHIRQLIYLYTAWTKDGHESTFTVTRILAQALSNLVTGNQELIDQFWDVQMQTSEEKSILIRLTGLPDPRSLMSVLVLVVNCIYDSQRARVLTTSIGVRVCVSILDRLEGLSDCPESGDEGKVFELGYGLFSRLFQLGLFPEVYRRTSMQDEDISPSQTTLLKLVDSFLQSIPASFLDEGDHLCNLAGFLASVFLFQAENGRRAIQQVTGTPSPEPRATTDVRDSGGSVRRSSSGAVDLQLSSVCVALVLLSTSLSSILLAERENGGGVTTGPNLVSVTLPCTNAISGSRGPTGSGFIESLLETLRAFDAFLPRINFGKVKPSYPHGDGGGGVPAQSAGEAGFSYLKRDLVRLLGILCYNNKAMQDRVRLCGGIPVVLNLCVIDDRNPYLREHALFAVRNLLHNNSENKAVVDTFRADEHVGL
ncbi:spinocerebellar ataxia type 10 protein domain-containing protein, partial [Lactarius vividus]